ncbi:MAG: helix-turn-helix domain-containing protein [Nocardiaceae bacterium]|nr:helix-turn-helix domain-containing protein [Nocardiaceae bacterium]
MVTLDRLINVLGGYGFRFRSDSVPRSSELRNVVIHEPAAEVTTVGDVLLAIGARSVREAKVWAKAAQAVVVLFRGEDDDSTADDVGSVAVMVVDSAVSWSEVAAVVYGLVLEGRETEAGRGPTDMFALADSLATAIGNAVTIEDRLSRVLAYSRQQDGIDSARVQTILDRQLPPRLRAFFEARGVFAHLAASDEPLFVAADPDHGLNGRMVVAVRTGRQLMGSVWVSCPTPLEGTQLRALTDGARTVGLHLLRSRASADLERQVEADLVMRLLDGTVDAALVASRLGLASTPLRVIAVHARVDGEQHAALLLAFERATTGFGWSRSGRSTLAGTTIYTVLPAEDPEVARNWVTQLRAALPETMMVTAGISGVTHIPELVTARAEADECLALHESRPPQDPPPAYDEAWDDILLQRLRAAARSGRVPARGPIADLRRHDRANSTQYAETLRAWLEAHGDPALAGDRLGVHENTVRYRMRKMMELTNLDLQDIRKRLAMMVELVVTEDD